MSLDFVETGAVIIFFLHIIQAYGPLMLIHISLFYSKIDNCLREISLFTNMWLPSHHTNTFAFCNIFFIIISPLSDAIHQNTTSSYHSLCAYCLLVPIYTVKLHINRVIENITRVSLKDHKIVHFHLLKTKFP